MQRWKGYVKMNARGVSFFFYRKISPLKRSLAVILYKNKKEENLTSISIEPLIRNINEVVSK